MHCMLTVHHLFTVLMLHSRRFLKKKKIIIIIVFYCHVPFFTFQKVQPATTSVGVQVKESQYGL